MINKSNGNLSFSNKSILKTHQTEISCINKNKNIRKTKINNNNLNKIMKDKKKKKNNLYYFYYFICPFFILKIKKNIIHIICI